MAHAAANSVEGKAEPFLKRIENILAEGESAKGAYMNECRQRREEIKSILTEAADAGVPKRALKGLVKYRELERKQAAIAENIEGEDHDIYDTLIKALGPLGQAAADRARNAA